MKEPTLFDPFNIDLFGAAGIVFEANGIAGLLEDFPALGRLGSELFEFWILYGLPKRK